MHVYIESKIAVGGRTRLEKDGVNEHVHLMVKVGSGDKEAFGILFSFYAPRIKALMMKQGSDANLAEDLMQETMLTVWQKSDQFSRWRGNVSSWIFTIARNKRIDRFRKQGTAHYIDVSDVDLEDDAPDSEAQVSNRERDNIVRSAAEELPNEQRQVIQMAFVEDLSQSEISDKLGIPLGTVKSRTRLAFGSIRKKLGDLI